jgi:hypothetical protein
MLTAIKLLHTLIWTFLAAGIVALPIAGVLRRFRWAAILTGLVLLECGVLALNGGRWFNALRVAHIGYHEQSAEDARRRITGFFRPHLSSWIRQDSPWDRLSYLAGKIRDTEVTFNVRISQPQDPFLANAFTG